MLNGQGQFYVSMVGKVKDQAVKDRLVTEASEKVLKVRSDTCIRDMDVECSTTVMNTHWK